MKNKNYQSIKTFSDACIALEINEQLFNQQHVYLSEYLFNTAKLEIINGAINGTWTPDWSNSSEYKYYPYFNMNGVSSGFGFSDSHYDCFSSSSTVGSRLCFETRDQANYTAKQFIEIYEAIYVIDKTEPSLKDLYSNDINIEIKKNTHIKDFDYKSIKTYDDACKKLGISSNEPKITGVLPELKKSTIATYKLMIVFKAINNGWVPDWSNTSEYKYYPWKELLSSGFGFSGSNYYYNSSVSGVGSRLCAYSSDVAEYIGEQFNDLYIDWFYIDSNKDENTSSITLEDMEKIYSIACKTWKEKIISLTTEYRDKNPFINKVHLPKKIVNEMVKACTTEQLPIVNGIFNKNRN